MLKKICLCLGLFLFPTLAFGQSADLSGYVKDPAGASVPDAALEIRNQDTGVRQRTTTNKEGLYYSAALKPGTYVITVQAKGFKTLTREGVVLNVEDHTNLDLALEVGDVSETVTVQSGGININTTDGSVGTVIDRNFVENIPLNGRSFQDLIDLVPGVVTQNPQSAQVTGIGASGDFSVNGQRTQSNNYIVDGVSANTNPGGAGGITAGSSGSLPASTVLGTTQSLLSVDALQEFRVESSTYSAEYGLSPGGQFSFVTRSGTNTVHGSLFDYFRNNILDANDWFNNHNGIAQPALRQNDFGGTVGGPVWIPGVYNGKNRTFFFLSYEGLRLVQPTAATPGEYVPSLSLRSAAPSVMQPILNAFPLPTGSEIQVGCDDVTFQCPSGQPMGSSVPSGLAPFLKAYSLPSTINSTLLRLDHQLSTNTHLFLRAAYTPSSYQSRPYAAGLSTQTSNQLTYVAGVDTQLSTSFVNEFRIGYSRSSATGRFSLDNFAGAKPINLAQAIGNSDSSTASTGFTLSFHGVGQTSLSTEYTAAYQSQWNLADNLSKSIGPHSLRAGFSYRRIVAGVGPFDPNVGPYYFSPTSILNNVADQALFERDRDPEPVFPEFAFFGQDEWRVRPSLSLSFGVRWEIDPAPHSLNAVKPYPLRGDVNDPSTFTLGAPGAALFNTTWGNLAPRLGVAWQIRNKAGAATVLRAGTGLFYDTGAATTYNPLSESIGAQVYTYVNNVALPVNPALYNGLTYDVSPPYNQVVYSAAPNFRLPYTLQWSAALEQQVGSQQNVTVSYVGANGRRLIRQNAYCGGELTADFPDCVLLYQNGLSSNYQALQLQFQRQVAHGLQVLASYTWSHSIDFGSSDADYDYVRGNSDFDLRNALNAAVTWDLPSIKTNVVLKTLLNGWGLDGRIFARSAFPVALMGNAFFDTMTGQLVFQGLDLVPGVPLYTYSPLLPGGREINANAFTSVPNGVVGDAPRNFVRGFGDTQIDMALRREFPLTESLKLQFRAEAFNVLNHPNFGYVDPNLGDATFGQATSTLAKSLGTVSPLYQQGGARSVQFALKLLF